MRTPLNTIIGMTNNLEPFITEERGRSMIKIVQNSSKILMFLVNDLLDFFKLKNGKFKINLKQSDIKNSISDIIEIF